MRVFPFLALAVTSLFLLKPSAAREALKVAPNVAWLGRPAPPTLRKLLPAKAQILKCGLAAFGPRGARRWVIAWTNRDAESDQDIKIGLFSQGKGGFRKWSERSILTQDIYLPIKLYWLQPSALSGPVIQLGETPIPKRRVTGEAVRIIVFPQGWSGRRITQTFLPGKDRPYFYAYEFPFIDSKGFLCLKFITEYAPSNDEGFTKESILKWEGDGWPTLSENWTEAPK